MCVPKAMAGKGARELCHHMKVVFQFITLLLYSFDRLSVPKGLRQAKARRRVPMNVAIRSDFPPYM